MVCRRIILRGGRGLCLMHVYLAVFTKVLKTETQLSLGNRLSVVSEVPGSLKWDRNVKKYLDEFQRISRATGAAIVE